MAVEFEKRTGRKAGAQELCTFRSFRTAAGATTADRETDAPSEPKARAAARCARRAPAVAAAFLRVRDVTAFDPSAATYITARRDELRAAEAPACRLRRAGTKIVF